MNVGTSVRVKGTKIEGVIGAAEGVGESRRLRVDYQDLEKGDCQHWASEAELQEAATPQPDTKPETRG